MEEEEFDSEIKIGELLMRSADEDGDFFIKVGKQRSTSLGPAEMKDIAKFLNYWLAQYEDEPLSEDEKDSLRIKEGD